MNRHLITFAILASGLVVLDQTPAKSGTVPEAHRYAECAACHGGGNSPQRTPATVARQCSSCHDSTSLNTGVAFHGKSERRCLKCHAFHEPDQSAVVAGAEKQTSTGNMRSANCKTCHDPRGNLAYLSASHRIAADLYHENANQLENISPSQACLNCHSNRTSSDWQKKTDGAILAFNEHASHPYSIRVIPGVGNSSNWIAWEIDERLPLFDEKMECQTCHLLTAGTDDLLTPFETRDDLCKGCHRQFGDKKYDNVVAILDR